MRFEVPQFIDVEDKIFGPLTFKQFLYLVGGGSLGYVSYKIIPSPFSWLFVLIFISLGLALAFYKLNNRPFIEVAQSYLSYFLKGKIYIWRRSPIKKIPVEQRVDVIPKPKEEPKHKKNIDSLAKNLDILDQ